MEFPAEVATARAVARLPVGPDIWYEPKVDGHRVLAWRTESGVRLQARSGREVTASWPDLAQALLALEPGTVLDGEAAVERGGRLDFSAAQSRKASDPARVAKLAVRDPATYFCWDVLRCPDLEDGKTLLDARALPYRARRQILLDLASGIGTPVVVVPATEDPATARAWYRDLVVAGFEGVVAKPGHSSYRGEAWWKWRHAETVDAEVVGYAGPPGRPRNLAVRLPDGRTALTRQLDPLLARQIAVHLLTVAAGPDARTDDGKPYSTLRTGLVVEVEAGTTRHATVSATRLR